MLSAPILHWASRNIPPGLSRLQGEVSPVVRRIRGVHDRHNGHDLRHSPFGELPPNADARQLDFLHTGELVLVCMGPVRIMA